MSVRYIPAFRLTSGIHRNRTASTTEYCCLSLSWKYRFSQNVNQTKVQSKTNKYCKFHDDLTRRRLPKTRFKKLGMVSKKLYRNTLNATILIVHFRFQVKYSEEQGMSFGRASRLLMFIGLASCISRLVAGVLCNLKSIDPRLLFQVGGFVSAVSVFLFTLECSYSLLVLFSLLYGLGQGIIVTTSNLTFLTCVDNKRRASAFGLANCLSSLAILSSPPLAGKYG